MKKLVASIAAIGMTFASVAAQANTRAGDAGVTFDAAPAFADDDDDDDDELGWLPILLVLLIGGGVIAAIGGDVSEGNDASPGTGG